MGSPLKIDKSSPQFRRGVAIERKEHPTLPVNVIDTLVMNHLTDHPFMYRKR